MMQPRWVLTVGLSSLVTVGLSLCAVASGQAASGNGPYYADPAWSQKLPTATRFVVLTDWGNQAVLDRETGLVWEKDLEPDRSPWKDLRLICANKTIGGRKGWRLPSVSEFLSLEEPDNGPNFDSLPVGHPFTGVGRFLESIFWTATTDSENPNRAWAISIADGEVFLADKVGTTQSWCVRGGMNADRY